MMTTNESPQIQNRFVDGRYAMRGCTKDADRNGLSPLCARFLASPKFICLFSDDK